MNWQEEREKAHCRVRDGESWCRLALEWGPWDPREPVSTCLRGSRVFPSAPQLRSSGGEAEIETPWWETIRDWPRESKRSKNTAGTERKWVQPGAAAEAQLLFCTACCPEGVLAGALVPQGLHSGSAPSSEGPSFPGLFPYPTPLLEVLSSKDTSRKPSLTHHPFPLPG